jgi:hypothetical protein
MIKDKAWVDIPDMEKVEDLPQLQITYARNAFPFILQYIGSPKSLFFRTLSRPLLYSTTPTPGSTSPEKR